MSTSTVITADIVNSTVLPKPAFQKLSKELETLLAPYKFEFYRGDSFQVYLKENEKALELILKIRLAAKRIVKDKRTDIDVRAGIGIGRIQSPVKILKTSSEEPFILSGRSLDELKGQNTRLLIKSFDDNANFAFKTIARFVDYLLKDITAKQAAVIFELLMGHTQTEIAKKLKKSQVTINKQVHAAGWMEIESLLKDYSLAINQFKLQ